MNTKFCAVVIALLIGIFMIQLYLVWRDKTEHVRVVGYVEEAINNTIFIENETNK